jgi:thymidylate synthase (FAD)
MKIQVLDHGYVEFIEAWGHGKGGENILDPRVDDEHDYEVGIIEAARQSTQGNFRNWGDDRDGCKSCDASWNEPMEICPICKGSTTKVNPGDKKLLEFLYNNKHATPFEFYGMVIEVQAPIFVFREWHRHRTQSYNEMSARYAPLPDINYVPSVERLMVNAGGSNKQAGKVAGAGELTNLSAESFRWQLEKKYIEAEELYQWALRNGVPKELARVHLPVGRYSRMRASTSLRNWLGFLTLRMDSKAQWEIRQFANAVGEIISVKFPQTWKLFKEEKENEL